MYQPTGLREPSRGHMPLGSWEPQVPITAQEGAEVTVGISCLTPHRASRPREGPRATCLWMAPTRIHSFHLAENLLRFVLSKLINEPYWLLWRKLKSPRKVVHFDSCSCKSGDVRLGICIPPPTEARPPWRCRGSRSCPGNSFWKQCCSSTRSATKTGDPQTLVFPLFWFSASSPGAAESPPPTAFWKGFHSHSGMFCDAL